LREGNEIGGLVFFIKSKTTNTTRSRNDNNNNNNNNINNKKGRQKHKLLNQRRQQIGLTVGQEFLKIVSTLVVENVLKLNKKQRKKQQLIW